MCCGQPDAPEMPATAATTATRAMRDVDCVIAPTLNTCAASVDCSRERSSAVAEDSKESARNCGWNESSVSFATLALIGAVAEYLSHEYALPRVPAWAFAPSRYLERAWHTTSFEDAGMREYLTFSSPAEFASRNIFTEERPLRRARGPLNRAGRAYS